MFISWEKASCLPLNKNGVMAPSGSNNENDVLKLVIILYITTNCFYNLFMSAQTSGSFQAAW